jgi:hypothetical protein
MSDVVMLRVLFGPLALASARDLVGNRRHDWLPPIAPPRGETRYSLEDLTPARVAAAFGGLEEDPDDERDEPSPPRRMRQSLPACLDWERL